MLSLVAVLFFFTVTATTDIYTLSLHDALPISVRIDTLPIVCFHASKIWRHENIQRSEERFSRNAETDLVCRLLLEKKKIKATKQAMKPCKRDCSGRSRFVGVGELNVSPRCRHV